MSEEDATSLDTGKLFEVDPTWKEHWQDMPEFNQVDARAYDSIRVYFRNATDKVEFLKLVGASPTRSRGIWYPIRLLTPWPKERTVDIPAGRYPVYIISKGRADTRQTAKALDALGLPYRIVVEPQEYDAYNEHIDAVKILTLPFSNLGQGSIPARNWVWEHSLEEGHRRHWILDDNIGEFARLNKNENRILRDENPFIACEDFADRYTNIALSGLQYRMFASYKSTLKPFLLNTRIYSCILIDNTIPFRWRGRYNEDTDLSIRVLKAGYCTVLFNAYLAGKAGTMTMAGGNTDELYAGDGRLRMAESLRDQHPDIVTVTEKWGRYQHHVDYTPFKRNTLQRIGDEPTELEEFDADEPEPEDDDEALVLPGQLDLF